MRGVRGICLSPARALSARDLSCDFFMARYEHLPIYEQTTEVAVHFEKVAASFSRYHNKMLVSSR
jgi:hypothetical protein